MKRNELYTIRDPRNNLRTHCIDSGIDIDKENKMKEAKFKVRERVGYIWFGNLTYSRIEKIENISNFENKWSNDIYYKLSCGLMRKEEDLIKE